MTSNIVCSGALFYAKNSKRFLFVLRNQGRTAGTWGIVGGRQEESDVSTYESLKREIIEEVGELPQIRKVIPLELFTSNDDKFSYHTYLLIIDEEFIPKLNHEHTGYAWCKMSTSPKPLHQGLKNTLNNKTIKEKLQTVLDILA